MEGVLESTEANIVAKDALCNFLKEDAESKEKRIESLREDRERMRDELQKEFEITFGSNLSPCVVICPCAIEDKATLVRFVESMLKCRLGGPSQQCHLFATAGLIESDCAT